MNILKTADYSMFVPHGGNRKYRRNKKLRASLLHNGFLPAYPIMCIRKGNKLAIVDGQHRFEESVLLKIPVYYVVVSESEYSQSIIPEINNAQKRWSPVDYLSSFITLGKESYVWLKDYSDRYQLPISTSVQIVSGIINDSGCATEKFKSGSLQIGNKPFAESIGRCIAETVKFLPQANSRHYVIALSRCMKVDGFSEDRYISKIKTNGNMLICRGLASQYIDDIEKIYNYRAPKSSVVPLSVFAKADLK